MRLSEAIRLGAMLRPQCFGSGFTDELDGPVRSCALAAAYESITGNTSVFNWAERLHSAFPVVGKLKRFPCLCGCIRSRSNVGDIIVHLNDDHRWTRQRIADWVETIEPQDEPQRANEGNPLATETLLKSANNIEEEMLVKC